MSNQVKAVMFLFFVTIGVVILLNVKADIDQVVDPEYYAESLEKIDTESTGQFFNRVNQSISEVSNDYTVYSFVPLFDNDSPTIVGAIIMYRRKHEKRT